MAFTSIHDYQTWRKFNTEAGDNPVVVAFVGPCSGAWIKTMQPEFERIVKDRQAGNVKFCMIDIEDTEFYGLVDRLKVEEVPTFILSENKKVTGRVVGYKMAEVEDLVCKASDDRLDFIGPQVLSRRSVEVGGYVVVKIGPWGGRSGTSRDIRMGSMPRYLETIMVRSTDSFGGRINGFSFVYHDYKGQSIPIGTWGSDTKGYEETITMGPGEHVNRVSGTADRSGVRSLAFGTNKGVVYGTYGYNSGTPFSLPLQQGGGEVLGFFGRAGDCLIALGTYVAARNATHQTTYVAARNATHRTTYVAARAD